LRLASVIFLDEPVVVDIPDRERAVLADACEQPANVLVLSLANQALRVTAWRLCLARNAECRGGT